MKLTILVLLSVFCSLAFAAGNHEITLFQPAYVGDVELKAGDYQLVVDGDHVVFMQGRRTRAEVEAKTETGGEISARTRIRYEDDRGRARVTEIHLGGTDTRLVFN